MEELVLRRSCDLRHTHLDEITLVVVLFFSEKFDSTRRPGSSELSSRPSPVSRDGMEECPRPSDRTSNQARIPAEFKHITKRRKRN